MSKTEIPEEYIHAYIRREQEPKYNKEFVQKINEAAREIEEGKTTTIDGKFAFESFRFIERNSNVTHQIHNNMQVIQYDPRTNSIIYKSDGRPRAGIIGGMADGAFKRAVENEIERLKRNATALSSWLWNPRNVNKPDWMSRKREYNAIQVKIEVARAKLSGAKKGEIQEISMPKNPAALCK